MITGDFGFVGRRKVERRTWMGALYTVSSLYAPRGPSMAYVGAKTSAGSAFASWLTKGAFSPFAANLRLSRKLEPTP